jgi:ribosomal protein L12E/L44/L45/RPP1/RPP2
MNRIHLITLAILALPSMTAHATEPLKTSVLKCTKIQQDAARLACFDNMTAQALLPSNVADVAKTAIKTPAAAPVATATKATEFGAEHLKKPALAEKEQQVVFTVEKLTKNPYGKWRLSFKNGQQWKQTDSAYLNIKVGDSVLLKKGFMGAIYLKKNLPNAKKKIRVKRLK